MAAWHTITHGLKLPAIAAPMFLVSFPPLVTALCKAGVVGTFPHVNARPAAQLDAWLTDMAHLPAGAVRTVDQALQSPEVQERKMVRRIAEPDGEISVLGTPFKFTDNGDSRDPLGMGGLGSFPGWAQGPGEDPLSAQFQRFQGVGFAPSMGRNAAGGGGNWMQRAMGAKMSNGQMAALAKAGRCSR